MNLWRELIIWNVPPVYQMAVQDQSACTTGVPYGG